MLQRLKDSVKRALLATSLIQVYMHIRHRLPKAAQVRAWEARGRPAPPPHPVKEAALREYARRFSLRVLVESGTYLGDMVYALRDCCTRIISVELSADLVPHLRRYFRSYPHVEIVQGDSGKVMPKILAALDEPALFWLDGHYSHGITARGEEETPVIRELQAIFAHPLNHCILIDDARSFGRYSGYPTLEEVRALVERARPGWVVEVEDDVIRIHRPDAGQG